VTTTDLIYEAIRKLRKELMVEIKAIVRAEIRRARYQKSNPRE
jgi:hypothetical protein